jgi:ABC-type cobalamin transport system ATPase subunit
LFGLVQLVKPTAQRLREVKIKFTNLIERLNVLGLSNKAILDNINKHFLAPCVAGIKRLLSGDLVIQALTEDDYKSLIANQKWLTSLGSTKKVLLERFLVFVHVVRITNIDLDKTKAI